MHARTMGRVLIPLESQIAVSYIYLKFAICNPEGAHAFHDSAPSLSYAERHSG